MMEMRIEFEGSQYIISDYECDISDQLGKPENTVYMTHKIEGFEEDLYLLVDDEEGVYFFGHAIAETGLFVTLQDEAVADKASRLIAHIGGDIFDGGQSS